MTRLDRNDSSSKLESLTRQSDKVELEKENWPKMSKYLSELGEIVKNFHSETTLHCRKIRLQCISAHFSPLQL